MYYLDFRTTTIPTLHRKAVLHRCILLPIMATIESPLCFMIKEPTLTLQLKYDFFYISFIIKIPGVHNI